MGAKRLPSGRQSEANDGSRATDRASRHEVTEDQRRRHRRARVRLALQEPGGPGVHQLPVPQRHVRKDRLTDQLVRKAKKPECLG